MRIREEWPNRTWADWRNWIEMSRKKKKEHMKKCTHPDCIKARLEEGKRKVEK